MSGKTPSVPVSVLKKRRRNAVLKAERKAAAAAEKAARALKRRDVFKRAESYVKEYRSREKSLIRLRRQAKLAGNYFVEPEAKLAFVIRIRGTQGIDPRSRKILQLLRLRQIHNGVFVKLNSASLQMLRLVEPFIAWGYPNLKTVKELIYKRGHLKVNKQRIPITDNAIIEDNLAHCNCVCIEDIVHEIFTVGEHFKEVNNSLWPMKLSSPSKGFRKIKKHFIEGGDAGNREIYINELVHRMN